MSNLRTALGGATASGPLAQLSEAEPLGMITLRGDLSDPAMAQAVAAAGGPGVPGQREILGQGSQMAAWMSPDELMVFCPYDGAPAAVQAASEALADIHGTAALVSDARAVFTLSGPNVRDVLAKLTPADLRPGRFGPGELRRTRIAQVPGAFWMENDTTLHVIVFRSVAVYAFDILSQALQTPLTVEPA